MKISVVFGTRPELIKLAPVIAALRSEGVSVELLSTGQHDEMLSQMLDYFKLEPDLDLRLMEPGQSPASVVGKGLEALAKELATRNSEMVVVQGDTGSTLAGAMAGFYQKIPVAHVEAGLRTGDLSQPFPEEGNRKLVDQISSLHFAATQLNKKNLLREGVCGESIRVTGNTAIDAILSVAKRFTEGEGFPEELGTASDYFQSEGPRILVTAHRRENFGEGMNSIVASLKSLLELRPNLNILIPVHPNPQAKSKLAVFEQVKGVFLVPPLSYPAMCYAIMKSDFLLSDSGGLQEEAPSLDKPVLVLREKTERIEGVEAGCARLIGTNSELIIKNSLELIDNPQELEKMGAVDNPYGDGQASQRIARTITEILGQNS